MEGDMEEGTLYLWSRLFETVNVNMKIMAEIEKNKKFSFH